MANLALSDQRLEDLLLAEVAQTDLAWAKPIVFPTELQEDPEKMAIFATETIAIHSRQARIHTWAMAPALYAVRTQGLWRHHPGNFKSFEEWLQQEEIGITKAMASDIITFWLVVLPECMKVGLTTEEVIEKVGTAKLRVMLPDLKAKVRSKYEAMEAVAAERGVDIDTLPEEDRRTIEREVEKIQDFPNLRAEMNFYAANTVADLVASKQPHKPLAEEERPIVIRLKEVESDGVKPPRWIIRAVCTREQMLALSRVHPMFKDWEGNDLDERPWERLV